jgi:protein-tyrosine-phosphatase/predicted ATP-grasp superfamily ATP-dependent carboligase
MERRRPKALVLGSDNGSFLSVVRSLGRRGIEVHIGWCPADAPAARSRYVHRSHRLPSPSGSHDWAQAFAELMARERFDLVLPTNDPTLMPLQLARKLLEPHGRLYLLNDRAFEITFDKVKTRQLAQYHGVPVAPGQVVGTVDEIDAALRGRRYPLIIRPQASFSIDALERRNSVARAYHQTAARDAIVERLQSGLVLLEENVNGIGWGVEVLAADGEVLLSQQHERLHEPLHGGGSSYRRTVSRNPEFMSAVTTMVRDLNYTGVAMFEFKGDPLARNWVLIEINGRFWGSLPLSLAAGIDFPFGLWQLLVHGRTDVANTYQSGVYARNLKRDLKWMWLNLRADRNDPTLATVALPRVAGEVTHILRRREYTDQFTVDDSAPGLAEFRQLGNSLLGYLHSTLVLRTFLRRAYRFRAQRALRKAETILFVCYGNICCSPFAARIAIRALPSPVHVISAGTSEDSERPSPSIAREVAREFGVDLGDHRSQTITIEVVNQADAIFVFDEENYRELRRRYPHARSKLHLIGALGNGSLIVKDPINEGTDCFRRAYATIADALSQGI